MVITAHNIDYNYSLQEKREDKTLEVYGSFVINLNTSANIPKKGLIEITPSPFNEEFMDCLEDDYYEGCYKIETLITAKNFLETIIKEYNSEFVQNLIKGKNE